ncbi:hypothetical protein GE061_007539 [Apolygus lucorum]|uniref:Uncharacterized protein n=1 Tax=Apolygus lucorum TaxID=248454 RepID=A0A6A4J087_APOLU|nr:hypothetical protein GE061_007539 [Apolygus lucorum]
MLKIVTLLVVIFAAILLHGAYGRSVDDVTAKPKLIRVALKRYEPPPPNVDLEAEPRSKRGAESELEMDVFDLKRGPLDSSSWRAGESRSAEAADEAPLDEFFRGFEAEEREEKMAASEAEYQISEVTEGRSPTDDEKQRFDVESSTPKIFKRFEDFEELSAKVFLQ